jgi:hypothetical protein
MMLRTRLRTTICLASTAVAILAPASVAAASHPRIVNPGDPGSTQYQEDVPSAFGNVPATHVHRGGGGTGSLPRGVANHLAAAGPAGRAAAALAIAGTPQTSTPAPSPNRRSQPVGGGGSGHHHPPGGGVSGSSSSAPPPTAGSGQGVLSALAGSVTGTSGGAGALLALLLVMAVTAAAVAARRRRGSD